MMREAKMNGLSDMQIGQLTDDSEMEVRIYRKALDVIPVVKQIDTLAAEYPAQTNYLYLTYHGKEDDIFIRAEEPNNCTWQRSLQDWFIGRI